MIPNYSWYWTRSLASRAAMADGIAKSVLLGTSFASTLAIVYGVELVSFAGVELTDLFSYYSVAVDPPSSSEMISTTMIISGLVTIPVQ